MSDAIIVSPSEIWGRLSKALGHQAAEDAVLQEIAVMKLDAANLDFQAALSVLEGLAKREGLTGVAARFARSRWMLQHSHSDLTRSREGIESRHQSALAGALSRPR